MWNIYYNIYFLDFYEIPETVYERYILCFVLDTVNLQQVRLGNIPKKYLPTLFRCTRNILNIKKIYKRVKTEPFVFQIKYLNVLSYG